MSDIRGLSERFASLRSLVRHHRYGSVLFAYVTGAILTGFVSVLFMRLFDFVFAHKLDFDRIGLWCIVTTPTLFLFSVLLIRHFGPFAEGAGIPQVVFAARNINDGNFSNIRKLLSSRTFFVKVAALTIGVWAGASTGREGPTVHVAACVFFTVMTLFQRWFGLKFEWRSVVIAGGSAGLAAAFNTPLAGVTFAIEELSSDSFGGIKDYVVIAIIFACMAAVSMTGQYSYFGRLNNPKIPSLLATLLIGLTGGCLGSLFSRALLEGTAFFKRMASGRFRNLRPILLSCVVLASAAIGGAEIFGPGNDVAKTLVEGGTQTNLGLFLSLKFLATLATYWSGIAGGIFAPCLSMGACLGATIAGLFHQPAAAFALLGMAAFLSGTIQAPLTAFVIIFEMTGNHELLVPVMLASFVSFIVARLLKSKHLYGVLAETYAPVLGQESSSR